MNIYISMTIWTIGLILFAAIRAFVGWWNKQNEITKLQIRSNDIREKLQIFNSALEALNRDDSLPNYKNHYIHYILKWQSEIHKIEVQLLEFRGY